MSTNESFDAPSQVRVTDAEIRAAKIDWLSARDGDESEIDVALRFEYFRMLISMQAQEIAEEFRAQHQR